MPNCMHRYTVGFIRYYPSELGSDAAESSDSKRPLTRGDLQVVCTLGPVSREVEILCELLKAGMSVARFNFSHGSHDYHQV
jgi:Pyruvate kinase, barrel domain